LYELFKLITEKNRSKFTEKNAGARVQVAAVGWHVGGPGGLQRQVHQHQRFRPCLLAKIFGKIQL
jgi:hypothetical protein